MEADDQRNIIIDCDTGIDDALAVILTIHHQRLAAITCVGGNAMLDDVCNNNAMILRACGALQVPIYRGCPAPIITGVPRIAQGFHGTSGLADVDTKGMVEKEKLFRKEHAVFALIRLVSSYPNRITLAAIGPLTNVAMAIRLYPEFTSKLKELVIMGGNTDGIGNITATGEFNFYTDPEAAFITLNSLHGCPTIIVPWETCFLRSNRFMSREWFDKWMSSASENSECGKLLRRILRWHGDLKFNKTKASVYHSCDPIALAIAMNRDIIKKSAEVYCTVECRGEFTRGQMVVDWNGKMGKAANATLVLDTDDTKLDAAFQAISKFSTTLD